MPKRGKILFGVLNWGLGHATRSIPVIQQLLEEDYEVIIASDGAALALLQREFPQLTFEALPGYHIRYSRNPRFFSLKLLSQTPHILQNMRKEKKITRKLVDKHQADLIISDNRFGFRDKRIRNIYITHQLRVLSGLTTPLTTWLHSLIYRRFNEIWVPDYAGEFNLSGKLGHLKRPGDSIKYIGPLQRMQKREIPKKYDIVAVLSGPEPQRTLLEKELLKKLQQLPFKTAVIQGLVNDKPVVKQQGDVDVYNYLTATGLEKLLNASELIISRSGYTSVMDLTQLQKKLLWIPTPGQKEQEYLAEYLHLKYGFNYQQQGKISLANNIFQLSSPTAILPESFTKEKIKKLIKKNFEAI